MATGSQVKRLLKAHFENNDEKFKTIALQIAASEAKKGYTKIARELKETIEKSKTIKKMPSYFDKNVSDMLEFSALDYRLRELIVSDKIKNRLLRILKEYSQRDKLNRYG